MAAIKLAVLNRSTVLTDNQVQAVVPSLQTQVSKHFSPVWGIDADLLFVPRGAQPPLSTWWLLILDNSDQPGDLGQHYNDLTSEGLPLGKVFAATDIQYGSQWTVTASHELLEMLADPDINLCASNPLAANNSNVAGGFRLYAYEVADACEADEYGYTINGVLVSDFVFPAWFESFRQPNSTQFDFQNKITAPFQLLPSGYISIYDVNSSNGWTNLHSNKPVTTRENRARVGSRRERRRLPRSQWLRSTNIPATHRISSPVTTMNVPRSNSVEGLRPSRDQSSLG